MVYVQYKKILVFFFFLLGGRNGYDFLFILFSMNVMWYPIQIMSYQMFKCT